MAGLGSRGPDLILFGLDSLLRPLQPLFQLRNRGIMPLTRDCSCSLQRVYLPIKPQLSTLSLLQALTQLRLVSVDLLDLFPMTQQSWVVSESCARLACPGTSYEPMIHACTVSQIALLGLPQESALYAGIWLPLQ